MHSELVSYIQSSHAADGVEVRAVGPKAITLALPPELHDLGNLCGELELRFNARVDLVAADKPGLGPTATVWVMQDAADGDGNDSDSSQPTAAAPECTEPAPQQPQTARKPLNKFTVTIAAVLGILAAVMGVLNHGTALWKHFEL